MKNKDWKPINSGTQFSYIVQVSYPENNFWWDERNFLEDQVDFAKIFLKQCKALKKSKSKFRLIRRQTVTIDHLVSE